jgi:hypothetical protein
MPSERPSLDLKATFQSESARGAINHLKIPGGEVSSLTGIGITKHYAVTQDQSDRSRSAVAKVTFLWSGRRVEYLPRLNGYALELLQICGFRLGFLQDGDVGVGVFPEGEEILIGGAGFGEGVQLRHGQPAPIHRG